MNDDVLLLWSAALGATAAVVANVWGALRAPRLTVLWWTRAALAAVYAVGYVWTITAGLPRVGGAWAATFRHLTVISWPVVWCLSPILAARRGLFERRHYDATREALADALRAAGLDPTEVLDDPERGGCA